MPLGPQQIASILKLRGLGWTQKEIAEQVELGIAKLDDRDAEIIILRLYEQLSNQEVASALSLSEPAASMRYLRAIRRLKEILVEAPGESNGLD